MNPEFAIISEKIKDELKIITIDTKKASYQGHSWLSLGDFGKRKFENLLVLSDAKQRMKILYI